VTQTPTPASFAAQASRQARMIEELRNSALIRRVVTPEGAAIRLKLAAVGERAGAFFIDLAIQWSILVVSMLGLLFVGAAAGFGFANVAFAVWLVFYFFLRNFYFIFFEISRRAATPGKRIMGMRVASRDGGRLTANAVLARNFMREIEFGLPMQFVLMSGGGGVDGWISLFGLLWTGIFLLFPLFNRDKLRVGDLVAGTWVIRNPKTQLLGDIVESAARTPGAAERYAFTPDQVDAYGIHELHVLEDVLRQSTPDIKAQVAARIRTKINWLITPGETDVTFLESYYAALRRRLEQRMLLGERKTDKFDRK
jgi:uncharacterized RDD family membrane protein YckC